MPAISNRVTAADVAASLGLSRATVGFVLNNTPGQSIPESTRKRVLDEAECLGYRPNAAAQALRRGSSRRPLVRGGPPFGSPPSGSSSPTDDRTDHVRSRCVRRVLTARSGGAVRDVPSPDR